MEKLMCHNSLVVCVVECSKRFAIPGIESFVIYFKQIEKGVKVPDTQNW